jgi:hypothetical protein
MGTSKNARTDFGFGMTTGAAGFMGTAGFGDSAVDEFGPGLWSPWPIPTKVQVYSA